uniref:Uncharacterized protein n=1 Tax=Lepeophtheirus salmonis TaxID=72036 RepID=A0A0K2VFS5_LEPSM
MFLIVNLSAEVVFD